MPLEEQKNLAEVEINFDGSAKEEVKKYLLPDDAYEAEFILSEAFEAKEYDSEKKIPRIVFSFKILNWKEEAVLPMFANPKITKGSGTYSNSKLYDLLEASALLGEAKNSQENLKNVGSLVSWFNEKLKGRKVKIISKTANKNKPKEHQYSVVDKLVKFLDVPESTVIN